MRTYRFVPACLASYGTFSLAAFLCTFQTALAQSLGDATKLSPVVVLATNAPTQFVTPFSQQSVTILSAENLRLSGISSATKLNRTVPNLSQSDSGLRSYSDNYFIRGIGNTEYLSAPAVVVYVDDVPYGEVATYMTDL